MDAFSARSWNHGTCVCGRRHRETGFFFPPNGLEDTVVRRAKSDGARGIFLVPTNRKAAFYMCLSQHAHASRIVRSDKDTFVHVVRSMPQHTLFAADLGSVLITPRRRVGRRAIDGAPVGSCDLWRR